ncbi:lantibiotic dehydratase C-terminal domain-containing protein [Streptomyces qinglanensis]|uniref:Thiopeptide-type bacteriocin biosynthesis domain-containing protein n=1 Tax=Streptomyces qinglanensis TaxID=943816 RepID=A0A1H9UCZ1_9ACTN|nr:lantibiotic dehydratase C-terminal domain-containing protein [Streptomyces qinglanensis]SES07440.1 thiopeptide-type bacteriocin biosynthesis domain-containing protein [Streptomyces qinglanensis]
MTSTAARPREAAREGAGAAHDAGGPWDWWYLRAYPGGPARMDAGVRAVLPWLAARAAELQAPDWHFLRYWDATGHHLRLRIRCTPEQADTLHSRTPEMRALLTALPEVRPADGGGLLPAEPTMAPRHQPVGVSPAPYAPERAKYGGTAGIAAAEEVFTDCCALLAETDLVALPAAFERAAAAVDLTGMLVAGCLAPGERDAFWTAHRRRWLARLRLVLPADETRERLRALASRVGDAPRPGEAVRSRCAAHAELVSAALDRCAAARVPVPRAELLLHHVHMTYNRLGFPPAEEAALVLAARVLTAGR